MRYLYILSFFVLLLMSCFNDKTKQQHIPIGIWQPLDTLGFEVPLLISDSFNKFTIHYYSFGKMPDWGEIKLNKESTEQLLFESSRGKSLVVLNPTKDTITLSFEWDSTKKVPVQYVLFKGKCSSESAIDSALSKATWVGIDSLQHIYYELGQYSSSEKKYSFFKLNTLDSSYDYDMRLSLNHNEVHKNIFFFGFKTKPNDSQRYKLSLEKEIAPDYDYYFPYLVNDSTLFLQSIHQKQNSLYFHKTTCTQAQKLDGIWANDQLKIDFHSFFEISKNNSMSEPQEEYYKKSGTFVPIRWDNKNIITYSGTYFVSPTGKYLLLDIQAMNGQAHIQRILEMENGQPKGFKKIAK